MIRVKALDPGVSGFGIPERSVTVFDRSLLNFEQNLEWNLGSLGLFRRFFWGVGVLFFIFTKES